ncbi:uncharacterized protein LTR77_009779 [Saxophila tyrrhenica]|uniref:Uncharacterized protein n=1 Tax=Saxophila tyrrhenica TaxID=1690608 RepID=A0AAV9P134_9PEZI|nr:hypothetical protein LTR77_009779 [Saxophila tyrrhenica]
MSSSQQPAPVGSANVTDIDAMVHETYGHVGEGLSVNDQTSPADLRATKQRFHRRRDLEAFASFPEGYIFINQQYKTECREPKGKQRAVILLSPPDQVAVQGTGKKWTRRARHEEADGPAPYTREWYSFYLAQNLLPGF